MSNTARCNDHCPEGRGCCLREDVQHTLHICHKAGCACHSAERYQPNAVMEPVGKPTQTHPPVMAKARHK